MSSPWLFSRRTDLAVFGGPALAALGLAAVGLAAGASELPPGLWLLLVLMVDVAHVWGTAYRVYLDGQEVRRRPWLYLGGPAGLYALGAALHAWGGGLLFWRVLAYGAVFHFVRQQYGWMRLYRRRAGERDVSGDWLDGALIYAATVVPLLHWHAGPPRAFHWFVPGDFVTGLVPAGVLPAADGGYLALLALYAARAVAAGRAQPWGKHLLLGSTAACWWLGIVTFDSDYVFSVTNVLIHGVPYLALVWRYGQGRWPGAQGGVGGLFRGSWVPFYAVLVVAALLEEGLWDNLVWHDHPGYFGGLDLTLPPLALALLVPLLALPQAVHYLTDGFVWRVGGDNPGLAARLRLTD